MAKKTKSWSEAERKYMALAFFEAQKVKGKTLPNPAVGAVLVKAGKIIGQGGTQPAGQAHAEIMALSQAGKRAKGSTLYVTLEPCSHFGRTPPCVEAVIAAGIKKVFVAIKDANPKVGGQGIAALKKAGIEVDMGLMEAQAQSWYAGFFFSMLNSRPKIILKIAQSLDGRINAQKGKETAITGEESRLRVHELRAEVDAVLIGAETLRIDNPDLTPRLLETAAKVAASANVEASAKVNASGQNPIPISYPEAIVLTRSGILPPKAKLFSKSRKSKTLVLHVSGSEEQTLNALLELFKQRGYHTVLVEGGRAIWGLFLKSGLWDSLYLATGSKVLSQGERWDAALPKDWGNSLKFRNFTAFGKDFWVEFGNTEGHE